MTWKANNISHSISSSHFCSHMYPRGVVQSVIQIETQSDIQSDYNKQLETKIKRDKVALDAEVTAQVSQVSTQTMMANKLCVICYSRLVVQPVGCTTNKNSNEKVEVVRLACSHTFHLECCTKWTAVQNCCPVCRAEIHDDTTGDKL